MERRKDARTEGRNGRRAEWQKDGEQRTGFKSNMKGMNDDLHGGN